VLQHNSANRPEIHQIAADFRAIADKYGERLLVGEICLPVPILVQYYGTNDAPGVHLPFNFQLLDAPWNPASLAQIIADYEAALPDGGWPNWVMGSHDAPRIAGRLGEAQARVAAVLLLTLRGTPTLYQGDELGIGLVDIPLDRIRDPQDLRQPGLGLGRDPARTPIPWDHSDHAGFSSVEPWLPLNDDWEHRNVAQQLGEPQSMLNLYKRLLALRRARPALSIGDFVLTPGDGGVLQYEREHQGERLLIALNLTAERRPVSPPDGTAVREPLLTTISGRGSGGWLEPNEGRILQLKEH
jgi:oligo-1,6-glucosidase/alpha-glucosidase